MTLEEIADEISEDLPAWQREINFAWLKQVHTTLNEGGVWGFPEQERIFVKKGEGFEEVIE
jgi:hypothetical protein